MDVLRLGSSYQGSRPARRYTNFAKHLSKRCRPACQRFLAGDKQRAVVCRRSVGSAMKARKEGHMAEDMTKITEGSLIAAEKVEGTDVYNRQGEKLGTVVDIMIDKISGRSVYAIMSFGGFLGIGEKYHPLPWSLLKYDTSKGGYVVDLAKDMLEAAPMYGTDEDVAWTPAYGRQVDDYYKAPSYW